MVFIWITLFNIIIYCSIHFPENIMIACFNASSGAVFVCACCVHGCVRVCLAVLACTCACGRPTSSVSLDHPLPCTIGRGLLLNLELGISDGLADKQTPVSTSQATGELWRRHTKSCSYRMPGIRTWSSLYLFIRGVVTSDL